MRHNTDSLCITVGVTTVIFLLFFMALPGLAGQAALIQLSDTTFQETSGERIWHLNRSKRFKTEGDATRYLNALNQGEFNDWRLPTKDELYKLFSIFDLKRNGSVKTRLEGTYWLTDKRGKMYAGAWEIGDQCGPSRTFYMYKNGYVRAVRP